MSYDYFGATYNTRFDFKILNFLVNFGLFYKTQYLELKLFPPIKIKLLYLYKMHIELIFYLCYTLVSHYTGDLPASRNLGHVFTVIPTHWPSL